MDSVAAFFDDSGGLDPGDGHNFVSLGMVVLPTNLVRKVSASWNSLIADHLMINAESLAVNGIEAKSSDLYDLRKRLKNGVAPKGLELPLYN
jgi:hypothetical protein